MADITSLSRESLILLKQLIERERNRVQNPTQRPKVDLEDYSETPEVYIAYTPEDGIPALSNEGTTGTGSTEWDDVAGYAECDLYRLTELTATTHDIKPIGYNKRVFNLTNKPVAGWSWITVIKDKHGIWHVPATGPRDITFLASYGDHIFAGIDTVYIYGDEGVANLTPSVSAYYNYHALYLEYVNIGEAPPPYPTPGVRIGINYVHYGYHSGSTLDVDGIMSNDDQRMAGVKDFEAIKITYIDSSGLTVYDKASISLGWLGGQALDPGYSRDDYFGMSSLFGDPDNPISDDEGGFIIGLDNTPDSPPDFPLEFGIVTTFAIKGERVAYGFADQDNEVTVRGVVGPTSGNRVTVRGGIVTAVADTTAGSITVGTTTISGGTNGYLLYSNSGVLGNALVTSFTSAAGGISISYP